MSDAENEDNEQTGGSHLEKKEEGGVGGFFKYVFNFDATNKSAILNMLQYTTMSIIPILLLLKGIKHLLPEEDDSKGSIEIAAESVGQLLFIMLALWFINKAIFYIPTYSASAYTGFNEITFILPFVLILATMQTKLGAKFQILIDRVMNKWHGREGYSEEKEEQQAQQHQAGQIPQQVSLPQYGTPNPMSATLIPTDRQYSQMPAVQMKQSGPPAGNTYSNGEPMAANEIGGSWGSSF